MLHSEHPPGPITVRMLDAYTAADRRDALIMLGRGVHLARATLGRTRYVRPALYWISPQGHSEFVPALAYSGDL